MSLPASDAAPALRSAPIRAVRTALPPVLAILLGPVIVGASGFSRLDVAHNASHDTRHAHAFPCH